jgi:hypothetical protein
LASYLNTSKTVPAALHYLRDTVDALQEHFKSVLELAPSRPTQFDSRGAWRIVAMMATRLINHCRILIASLPDIKPDDTANARIWRTYAKRKNLPILKEETDRMNTLVQALALMILACGHGEVVSSEDIEQQLATRVYIQPFWWLFDSDTARFHDMLNLLKATVAETLKKENFFSRVFTAATHSVSLFFSSNQHLNKEVRSNFRFGILPRES